MRFTAKAKFVRYSPYKLRPLADVIRGKKVTFALGWLTTCALKKSVPLKKLLESAVANARNMASVEEGSLCVKEICIDQGPVIKYFKPGAMGRANPQRKRLSHLKVVLERIEKKEA